MSEISAANARLDSEVLFNLTQIILITAERKWLVFTRLSKKATWFVTFFSNFSPMTVLILICIKPDVTPLAEVVVGELTGGFKSFSFQADGLLGSSAVVQPEDSAATVQTKDVPLADGPLSPFDSYYYIYCFEIQLKPCELGSRRYHSVISQ